MHSCLSGPALRTSSPKSKVSMAIPTCVTVSCTYTEYLSPGGQATPNDFDSKTAALPRAHAAAIRKRMDSFRTTMKTRHGPDLRTVFKSQGAPSTGTPPPAPPPPENAHPIIHSSSSLNFRASPAPPSYAQTMAEVATRSMTPTLAREPEEEDIKLVRQCLWGRMSKVGGWSW